MGRKKKKVENPKRDLLMWVGTCHYSSIEGFVEEAERVGVSKRIAKVPVNLGDDTLLFLAHDEGKRIECVDCRGLGIAGGRAEIQLVERKEKEWVPVLTAGKSPVRRFVERKEEFDKLNAVVQKESKYTSKWTKVPGQLRCESCKGWGRRPDGRIFGFCRVSRVELVLDSEEAVREYTEKEKKLLEQGKIEITPVVGGEGVEELRGCGFRTIGAMYLVSGTEEAAEELKALAEKLNEEVNIRGTLVVLENPVLYTEHRFFGTKLVNREEILGRGVSIGPLRGGPKTVVATRSRRR